MAERSRASRFAVYMSPAVLGQFNTTQAAWFESEEDVRAGLEWGRRKAVLLRWIRKQMGRRLTPRERQLLELYFFEGLTYRETADRAHTNLSHVHRTVQRALHKLRAAADEDAARLRRFIERPRRVSRRA